MKACVYCAKQIHDLTMQCLYCGSRLDGASRTAGVAAVTPKSDRIWVRRLAGLGVVCAILVVLVAEFIAASLVAP